MKGRYTSAIQHLDLRMKVAMFMLCTMLPWCDVITLPIYPNKNIQLFHVILYFHQVAITKIF